MAPPNWFLFIKVKKPICGSRRSAIRGANKVREGTNSQLFSAKKEGPGMSKYAKINPQITQFFLIIFSFIYLQLTAFGGCRGSTVRGQKRTNCTSSSSLIPNCWPPKAEI